MYTCSEQPIAYYLLLLKIMSIVINRNYIISTLYILVYIFI